MGYDEVSPSSLSSAVLLGCGYGTHPPGTPWITDSGLNALVSVDPSNDEVRIFPLPDGSANANLNTAAFDGEGVLWLTGQNGIYGRLDPAVGEVEEFAAPEAAGPTA